MPLRLSPKSNTELKKLQHRETVLRYQFINGVLKETYKIDLERCQRFESGS